MNQIFSIGHAVCAQIHPFLNETLNVSEIHCDEADQYYGIAAIGIATLAIAGLTFKSLASREAKSGLRTKDIDVFVKEHGVDFKTPDPAGETLLTTACKDQNIHRVDQILKHKPDINLGNAFGTTPLHYACLNANIPIAKKLLHAGANTLAKNSAKQVPAKLIPLEASEFFIFYARAVIAKHS